MPTFQLQLYGSLAKKGEKASVAISVDTVKPLSRILQEMNIDADRVQLMMINHRAVRPDAKIRSGDRVALFPKEYPVFVDWHPFRW